jgi:hypothetical protein
MAQKLKPAKMRKSPYPPCLGPAALHALVETQGKGPVGNINELVADFWPEEETTDYIVATVHRNGDRPRRTALADARTASHVLLDGDCQRTILERGILCQAEIPEQSLARLYSAPTVRVI